MFDFYFEPNINKYIVNQSQYHNTFFQIIYDHITAENLGIKSELIIQIIIYV